MIQIFFFFFFLKRDIWLNTGIEFGETCGIKISHGLRLCLSHIGALNEALGKCCVQSIYSGILWPGPEAQPSLPVDYRSILWFKFQMHRRQTRHLVLKTEETDLHYLPKSISNWHRDRLHDSLQIYLIELRVLKRLYFPRLCSTLGYDGWAQSQNLCNQIDTIPRVTAPWNPLNFQEKKNLISSLE